MSLAGAERNGSPWPVPDPNLLMLWPTTSAYEARKTVMRPSSPLRGHLRMSGLGDGQDPGVLATATGRRRTLSRFTLAG